MRKEYTLFFMLILPLIIALTACGNGEGSKTDSETTATAYDWKESGFAFKDQQTDSLRFVTDYKETEYQEPKELLGKSMCMVSGDQAFYTMDNFYTSGETICQFRKIAQDGSLETELTLDTGIWGIENGSVLKMDHAGAGELVFFVGSEYGENEQGQWEAGRYFAVFTDEQCRLSKLQELTEVLRTNGIWESSTPKYGGTETACDGDGNLYLRDAEIQTIFTINNSGECVGQYHYPVSDREAAFMRCDTGELLYVLEQDGGKKFVLLSAENGQTKEFPIPDKTYIQKWYGLRGNTVFYATNEELVGWNIADGSRQILFRFQEYEIGDPAATALLGAGTAEMKLLVTGQKKRYVLELSEQEPETCASLSFANIGGEDSFLKGRIINFSRVEPLYQIDYQEAYRTEEDRNRALLEMVNGAGPDVLYMTLEDADSLIENGAVAGLDTILSAQNREALLPGAMEMGSRNGELYYLPFSVYISTLVTSRQYWTENTWKESDVLRLSEEHEEIGGLFVDPFGVDDYFYNLYYLVGMNLRDSRYLTDGEADFDCEEFRKALMAVKEKTGNVETGNSFADMAEKLNDGEILGVSSVVFGMREYGTVIEKIGENTCIVGYPSEQGKGNYLMTNGVLVVNKNAADKAGVAELINYLFGLDTQLLIKDAVSVRKDVPERLLAYDEYRKHYYLAYPDETRQELPDRYDKSTYLDEYLAFIESAVPRPTESDSLFEMVMEEADSYFSSGKSLDETVKTIQNRVQLYLDERK